jgi:transcriptional regulator with XRE-family HTH domain
MAHIVSTEKNALASFFQKRLDALMHSRTPRVTQKVLAEAVGVEQPTVGRWLDGSLPEIDKLLAIADSFGVSINSLLHESTDSGSQLQPLHDAVVSCAYCAAAEHRAKKAETDLKDLLAELYQAHAKYSRRKSALRAVESDISSNQDFDPSVVQANIDLGPARAGKDSVPLAHTSSKQRPHKPAPRESSPESRS